MTPSARFVCALLGALAELQCAPASSPGPHSRPALRPSDRSNSERVPNAARARPDDVKPTVDEHRPPPDELQQAIDAHEAKTKTVLGRSFPTLDAFCRAWDDLTDATLESLRALPDSAVPKHHRCRAGRPLLPNFKATAEIRALTSVQVFMLNGTERLVAITTPAGVVVPDIEPIEADSFRDPHGEGFRSVVIDSATAHEKALEILFTDRWSGQPNWHERSSDGSRQLKLVCASDGDCTQTELSRICHLAGNVVDCSVFDRSRQTPDWPPLPSSPPRE